jgi:antitoxin ParD1/3/4
MNVSIGTHWEQFVDGLVKSGRYGTASEVVRDGLRLVEAREAKFKALKDEIDASIAEGGSYTADEVRQYLREQAERRRNPAQAAE